MDELVFYRYCEQERFRSLVRQAVNNEVFWQTMNLDSRAQNAVNTAIHSQLPAATSASVSAFVQNNTEVNRVLESHVRQMREKIADAATQQIKTVVDDPKFHQVNSEYFASIDRRVNSMTNDQRARWDAKLTVCDAQFKKYEQRIQRCERKTKTAAWGLITGGLCLIGAGIINLF